MSADARAAQGGQGFRTARELYDAEPHDRGSPLALAAVDHGEPGLPALLVTPEVGIEEAKRIWNGFLQFRDVILSDPACYDVIAGRKEMNRAGATRLAVPFGLSVEERETEEGRVELADNGGYDYRYRVRIRVSKGSRFVDGVGSCRVSEIAEKAKSGETVPLSQREHFALTKAWTRAVKRAIADILGGTEAD